MATLQDGSDTAGKSRISEFPFIESYGMERKIREIGFSDCNDSDFTSRDQLVQYIAGLAEKGNEKAMILMENEAENFAIAIMRLKWLFDPELLVLQGDITAAGPAMEEKIRSKVREINNFNIPLSEIKFSSLSQRTVTLGAVSQAMDKLTETVI